MPKNSNASAGSSAPTSSNEPQAPHSTATNKPTLTESAFLTKEAADAKAAISRVIGEITGDLGHGIDPRAWVETAPWTTLAGAAIAGFAAVALTVPSKEQQAMRRLRKIEEALATPARHYNGDATNGNGADHPAGARPAPGMLATIASHAAQMLTPLLSTALTTMLKANAVPAAGADGSANGADGSAPATPDAAGEI